MQVGIGTSRVLVFLYFLEGFWYEKWLSGVKRSCATGARWQAGRVRWYKLFVTLVLTVLLRDVMVKNILSLGIHLMFKIEAKIQNWCF